MLKITWIHSSSLLWRRILNERRKHKFGTSKCACMSACVCVWARESAWKSERGLSFLQLAVYPVLCNYIYSRYGHDEYTEEKSKCFYCLAQSLLPLW